jgi:hypothetical protein
MTKKSVKEKTTGKGKTTIHPGDATNKIKNPPKPETTENSKT